MKTAIIGAENMGGSIARGLAKGTIVLANDIIVSNPTQHKSDVLKAESPALQAIRDNQEAITGVELIISAVKPWLTRPVVSELKLKNKQILISVAAGTPLEKLTHYVADKGMTMFRLTSNTAINETESMTLIASRNTSKGQEQLLFDIFNQMGFAMSTSEDEIVAATAMTSCSIAYVLKYIQAVMRTGIEMGTYPRDGICMVAQPVKGAAGPVLSNGAHPSIEIDKARIPGGITIKGINELERQGFPSAIISAIKASK